MGDPITTGILVGAAMGGGGAALKGQDPLKGALIGGATGGIGGGIAGGFGGGSMGGASSPFSLGSILNGVGTNAAAGGDPAKGLAMNAAALAGSGGGFGGGGYGSIGTAGQTASGASGIGSSISNIFSGASGMGGMGGTGNIFGQGGTLSQAGQGLDIYNKASQAFGGNEQLQYAPVGQVQRGQVAPMDYMSLLNPQNQSVMRPQPISLL